MGKTLICYFSASGNTKAVAEKLAKMLKGDLFEIEPKEKYTAADLDWTDSESRASKEMNDRSFRPEIAKTVSNIDDYDRILLGFPVWWYTAPTIINTFIESNDLTDKNIYIFVTSGSSDVNTSFDDLSRTYPNLRIIRGIRFTGDVAEDEVASWLG